MQFGPAKPPVGIIYDSDFGNRIDDALALALLYGFDGKNDCRVVSITISKPNLKAAALAEVIGRFYAGAVSGAFNAFGRTLPVGLATAGGRPEDTPLITGVLSATAESGKPKYDHGVHSLNDTADPRAVIRNAFTSQYDQNCIMVLAGPATNLAQTLELPGVKALVERKVRYLVMMGGDFSGSSAALPETNIKTDIAAARKVLAEWPTDVILTGYEVGSALRYPGASIEKDFAWSPAHPVADAYRAAETMPYDAGSWDMTAILYAVKPGENYFKLSDSGTVQIADDGRTSFTKSSQGRHRHLILDPAQSERVIKTYIELASAKPVVRMPRFRPPQQQVKPPEPPKPPTSKP